MMLIANGKDGMTKRKSILLKQVHSFSLLLFHLSYKKQNNNEKNILHNCNRFFAFIFK